MTIDYFELFCRSPEVSFLIFVHVWDRVIGFVGIILYANLIHPDPLHKYGKQYFHKLKDSSLLNDSLRLRYFNIINVKIRQR